MNARALWYADGLRWIGSLFQSAADRLDQPSLEPAAGEPIHRPAWDEYLFEVRQRLKDPL